MSEANPSGALVERILAGDAPLPLRQAAARGALPLPRVALTRLYVALLGDAEESIRTAARGSLDALPQESVVEVLGDADCAPEVLRHYAPRAARDAAMGEKIAFHPSTPVEALTILAAQGSAAVVDLMLTNQERLLSTRGLLDRLTENPALRPDQRGKILDFLESLMRDWGASAEAGDGADSIGDLAPEVAARLLEVDVGELFAASEIMGGEELEQSTDMQIRSAYRRILTMSPGQKAVLAMKGGREERMILVRDTNKVVALGVVKNPRLTEQDVEDIARLRNVSEEVLRAVGANREWSKRYAVAQALVRNPRTPPGISMNILSRLVTQDLKDLIKDRNVPELVRRNSKRLYEARTQKTTKVPGKK